MLDLKQSTSAVINFGPIVDKDDGITPETGLVSALDHASTGIKLSKNGGAKAVRSATVTTTIHDGDGEYRVTLSATDTNTLGRLRASYSDPAVCGPMWTDFKVIDAEEWERKYGKGAPIVRGTCVASGSSQILLKTTGLSPGASVTNQFKQKVLTFDKNTTTAALRGQSTVIEASNTSGDLTVTQITTVPADGDTFTIS